MTRDPHSRFTDRVEHYVRHRPRYPDVVIDALVERDILFYTNGTLGLREEYTWLRTGDPINPG